MMVHKTIAYQLGYNNTIAPKTSINYHPKLVVPLNSFSQPEIQILQYIQGWQEGRNV